MYRLPAPHHRRTLAAAPSLNSPDELEHKTPRRVFGVPLIWPAWLSNAWPRVLLFLLLGTFSTTLVAVPAATSWMLIALVVMAILTAHFPEQRIFCRYLCPINSYISLYSTTGRVMVRSVSAQACGGCKRSSASRAASRGGAARTGSASARSTATTIAAPAWNASRLAPTTMSPSSGGRRAATKTSPITAEAWQAIVMLPWPCLYCFINLGAWDTIRDWIDIVDKQNWGKFSVYAAVVWVVCLRVLPLLWYLLTKVGILLGRFESPPPRSSASQPHRSSRWVSVVGSPSPWPPCSP